MGEVLDSTYRTVDSIWWHRKPWCTLLCRRFGGDDTILAYCGHTRGKQDLEVKAQLLNKVVGHMYPWFELMPVFM